MLIGFAVFSTENVHARFLRRPRSCPWQSHTTSRGSHSQCKNRCRLQFGIQNRHPFLQQPPNSAKAMLLERPDCWKRIWHSPVFALRFLRPRLLVRRLARKTWHLRFLEHYTGFHGPNGLRQWCGGNPNPSP